MARGILRANGNIHWMPGGAKEPLLYSRTKYEEQGAILFPPYWNEKKVLETEETVASVCSGCGKMIVDCPIK